MEPTAPTDPAPLDQSLEIELILEDNSAEPLTHLPDLDQVPELVTAELTQSTNLTLLDAESDNLCANENRLPVQLHREPLSLRVLDAENCPILLGENSVELAASAIELSEDLGVFNSNGAVPNGEGENVAVHAATALPVQSAEERISNPMGTLPSAQEQAIHSPITIRNDSVTSMRLTPTTDKDMGTAVTNIPLSPAVDRDSARNVNNARFPNISRPSAASNVANIAERESPAPLFSSASTQIAVPSTTDPGIVGATPEVNVSSENVMPNRRRRKGRKRPTKEIDVPSQGPFQEKTNTFHAQAAQTRVSHEVTSTLKRYGKRSYDMHLQGSKIAPKVPRLSNLQALGEQMMTEASPLTNLPEGVRNAVVAEVRAQIIQDLRAHGYVEMANEACNSSVAHFANTTASQIPQTNLPTRNIKRVKASTSMTQKAVRRNSKQVARPRDTLSRQAHAGIVTTIGIPNMPPITSAVPVARADIQTGIPAHPTSGPPVCGMSPPASTIVATEIPTARMSSTCGYAGKFRKVPTPRVDATVADLSQLRMMAANMPYATGAEPSTSTPELRPDLYHPNLTAEALANTFEQVSQMPTAVVPGRRNRAAPATQWETRGPSEPNESDYVAGQSSAVVPGMNTPTSAQIQRIRSGDGPSQKRMRFSKGASPSTYCHICGRSAKTVKIATCMNSDVSICRKVLCEKCLLCFDRDPRAFERADIGEWECTHCRGICPEKARCFQYTKNNQKRRERNEERRRQERERVEDQMQNELQAQSAAQALAEAQLTAPPPVQTSVQQPSMETPTHSQAHAQTQPQHEGNEERPAKRQKCKSSDDELFPTPDSVTDAKFDWSKEMND